MSDTNFIRLYQTLNQTNKSQFISFSKQFLRKLNGKKSKTSLIKPDKNSNPTNLSQTRDINLANYIKTTAIYQNNQMFYQDEHGNLFHPKTYNITLVGKIPMLAPSSDNSP